MNRFLAQLRCELERLEAKSLLRRLQPVASTRRLVRIAGRDLINLTSNDYLGISQHRLLKAAAIKATEAFGTGATASRLAGGHLDLHAEVERRFAEFKHAEGALLLPTGYMANLAVLTALAGSGDLICLDKLNHASLIDAARASGAVVRCYPHLDTVKLERLLAHHARNGTRRRGPSAGRHREARLEPDNRPPPMPSAGRAERAPRRFIVTDSVFSMDGDVADLPALCELADRYEAILVVDDAHGTGVLGASGAGLCEQQGVSDRVGVVVSTASKALGGLGGIVTAARPIIQTLVNRAHPLIYTTAVPAAQAAVVAAALDIVRDEPWRRKQLETLARRLRHDLRALRWSLPPTACPTPIVPLVVKSPQSALALAAHLRAHGLLAMAIRPPTVPPAGARVRLSLRADLEDSDLDQLIHALRHFERPQTP